MTAEKLNEFYKQNEKLEKYRILITRILKRKEHTLSAKEEEILAKTFEISSAPEDIFSLFNTY